MVGLGILLCCGREVGEARLFPWGGGWGGGALNLNKIKPCRSESSAGAAHRLQTPEVYRVPLAAAAMCATAQPASLELLCPGRNRWHVDCWLAGCLLLAARECPYDTEGAWTRAGSFLFEHRLTRRAAWAAGKLNPRLEEAKDS